MYQALMAHHIHEDSLMWRQVAHLLTLQAGVFAGGWLAKGSIVSIWLVVLGFVLTILWVFMFLRVNENRLVNRDTMDVLAERLLSDDAKDKIWNEVVAQHTQARRTGICCTPSPPPPVRETFRYVSLTVDDARSKARILGIYFRGTNILGFAFLLCLVADLLFLNFLANCVVTNGCLR